MESPAGLFIVENWIDEETEQELVDFLCKGEWSKDISSKRPTQHFGYKYEISGCASSWEKVAKDWGPLDTLAKRLEKEYPGVSIVQALANLYFKDSGIGMHVDKNNPEVIFGVSLTSDINMDWTNIDDPKMKRRLLIPRRSLYIMTGDSATKWKHSVPCLKRIYYPKLDKHVIKPGGYCRVSITFRYFNTSE